MIRKFTPHLRFHPTLVTVFYGALLMAVGLVFAIEPAAQSGVRAKRIIILSRYSAAIQDAKKQFDAKYGAGLIEVVTGENDIPAAKLNNADVIFLHLTSGEVFERLAVQAKAAAARGALVFSLPADNAERFWNIKPNAALVARADKYWEYGGTDNMLGFLAMLYETRGGKLKIATPKPEVQATSGIYHPRSDKPFLTLNEYLAWYRSKGFVPASAPLAAITFYSNHFKFKDAGHIDAIVAKLEKNGIGALPVFGSPTKSLRPFLGGGGKSPIRVILALNLGFSKQEDADEFEMYGVPVINLLTTRMSEAEWMASVKGIEPQRLAISLNSPERAGANEPTMVATAEKIEGSDATQTSPIDERVDSVVKRTRRWITLQDKPNPEKKIGFIYYSNPPGKGYLGASYLNLMPSLLALIERLKKEGYNTGTSLENEQQLIDILHKSGRNIEQWAPGELDEMAKDGGVTLLPVSRYRELYKGLPAGFRSEVERVWGAPEKADLMTVKRGGVLHFVLPGVKFGNIFLGPQPLRSTFARQTQVQHDVLTPPPHSYVAAYLWYRHEFKADAVVHMGRHGTLEWLPGKQVGQAGHDSSEAMLGDLPNPYYFIIDGGGEAIQARRRSHGTMIGHLSPLTVPGGKQGEYAALHDAIEQYEKAAETTPQLAEEYKKQIVEQIKLLKLEAQLGFKLEGDSWETVLERAHDYVHSIETDPSPMGQPIIGTPPPEAVQREALQYSLRTAFSDEELVTVDPQLKALADAIYDGETSLPQPTISNSKTREKYDAVAVEGKKWIENIRRSPGMELEALVKVLSGRYLTSGNLGDPLRNPMSIPSGRNLHDFDTALIPTKAAWELGKKMAVQTLERFKKEKGAYPEKVSMVLWYGETSRNQGAMESEAMYMMGVEPIWNSRGVIDGLRPIPDAELGRPRVDVILTISGIYRDGFADKLLWLDRAARLAASLGDNAISRNDKKIEEELKKNGVAADKAKNVAKARVFGAAPGMYGVGGIGQIADQSLDNGKELGLAEMYLHHMNNAYSEEVWGEEVKGGIDQHLKGNQAVIHPRTTNVYGLLDNDDSYQFAGGLNIATKSVNAGAVPQFYINNMRLAGRERVEDFRTFLVKEMSTRYWNPKWIKEQQKAGYAGARQFIKEMEHLYGWQATSKEHIDGQLWQKSFDVYVADKHGLEMDEFFEKYNPHVRQWQLSRMLEIDEQGTYKFSDADRSALVERYVKSVIKHGAACSANTCGNATLHQFIADNAAAAGISDGELQAFAGAMSKATHWTAEAFAQAPAAFRAGLVQGLGQQNVTGETTSQPSAPAIERTASAAPVGGNAPGSGGDHSPAKPQTEVEPVAAPPIVSGYELEEKVIEESKNFAQAVSTNPLTYVAILGLIIAGLLWEWRRRVI